MTVANASFRANSSTQTNYCLYAVRNGTPYLTPFCSRNSQNIYSIIAHFIHIAFFLCFSFLLIFSSITYKEEKIYNFLHIRRVERKERKILQESGGKKKALTKK